MINEQWNKHIFITKHTPHAAYWWTKHSAILGGKKPTKKSSFLCFMIYLYGTKSQQLHLSCKVRSQEEHFCSLWTLQSPSWSLLQRLWSLLTLPQALENSPCTKVCQLEWVWNAAFTLSHRPCFCLNCRASSKTIPWVAEQLTGEFIPLTRLPKPWKIEWFGPFPISVLNCADNRLVNKA